MQALLFDVGTTLKADKKRSVQLNTCLCHQRWNVSDVNVESAGIKYGCVEAKDCVWHPQYSGQSHPDTTKLKSKKSKQSEKYPSIVYVLYTDSNHACAYSTIYSS